METIFISTFSHRLKSAYYNIVHGYFNGVIVFKQGYIDDRAIVHTDMNTRYRFF